MGGEETVVGGAEDDFRDGAPPMIPPSRNLMAGDLVEKISAIDRALRGEMAFKSRKYRGVGLGLG